MWTSLCNFFCEKLFHRSEGNAQLGLVVKQPGSDCKPCIYGKRIKLSNNLNINALPRNNSALVPMQKENINKSDDEEEEECCVIAEIPRRKKPVNTLAIFQSPTSTPLNDGMCNITSNKLNLKLSMSGDKDKQMSPYTSNSLSRARSEALQSKSSKFFNSPRISLSQSKYMRCRLSYKNSMKKSLNFLKESYRLTEKYQYMQLLQSHTTYNLLTHKPKTKEITYKPKEIPVIDLTDDITKEKAETEKLSEEEDVQIVKEVPGVRTFQDILKITPVDTSNIVKRILSRHSIHSPEPLDSNSVKENALCVLDDDITPNDNQETSEDVLEKELRALMKISESSKSDSFAKITTAQEEKINKALDLSSKEEFLVEGFGLKITRRDLQTLVGLNWLNDEVINFYMNLIMERSRINKSLPKVYAFNTFFYPKLVSYGYESLKRWTKQVDIFSYDIIFVPVHLGMHWCLAVIDFRCRAVLYYDSVASPNDSCLEALLLYLRAESLDKKNKVYFTSNWEKSNVKDIPQQMNGSDCGVFSCMFAEHIARDCGIFFSQVDMPYFRKKMMIEILEKKLLT